MSSNLTLLRGVQLLSATAAKFGSSGRETGVFSHATVEDFLVTATVMGTGTFEAWINVTAGSSTSYKHILSRDEHFYLSLLNGTPILTYGATAAQTTLVSAGGALSLGWHHVAAVFESGAGRLYVDGVRQATSAVTRAAGTPTQGFEVGGFAATSSQDFVGYIDEVAISTTAQYTGTTYTTPVAAFSNTRSGQVAVWHLNGDLSDANGGKPSAPLALVATPGNGQVSLAWTAPLSAGDSAISDYLIEKSPTGAGTWTTFVDAVSTVTTAIVTGLTNGTIYDFRVSAVNTQGTGDPCTTVTGRPAVILASDANIISSDNFHITASRALTIWPGAYRRMEIQGSPTAITLLFDVVGLVGNLPDIKYRVDHGPWTRTTIASSLALTMPSGNIWLKHTVEYVVRAMNRTANRWSGVANAVREQGVVTTPSTCSTVALPRRNYNLWFFGDSLVEACLNLQGSLGTGPTELDSSDALEGFALLVGEALGAEVSIMGCASQGWLFGGYSGSGVPTFPNAWPYIYSAVPIDWTTRPPDLVVIEHGTNDGNGDINSDGIDDVGPACTAVLNGMLALLPARSRIAVMKPVNSGAIGTGHTHLPDGIAACADPGRVKYIDTAGFFALADSGDNIHPWGYAHRLIALKLAAALKPLLPGVARGSFTWAA